MPWFIIAIVLKMVLAWIESQITSAETVLEVMRSTVADATDLGFSNRLGNCQGQLLALLNVRDKIESSLEQKRW